MKKIAFFIGSLAFGGAERAISNLANAMDSYGNKVYMITSYEGEMAYQLSEGITFKALLPRRKASFIQNNFAQVKELRQLCKTWKIDLLVSFMAEPNFRAVAATVGLPTKTIISVRSDPNIEYAGFLNKMLAKTLLVTADGCVFQTEDAKKWFPKKLQKKSMVIFNDVKETFFNTEWNPDEQQAVAVGRLDPAKNYPIMIESFAAIIKKFPDAKLCIYGSGPEETSIQQLITEKHLQNNIFLKGITNNVPEVLSHASVFIMTSDYEGMPNALMEALAVGVPCVSTDCPCGGPRALIQSGYNGYLASVGDSKDIASCVINILENKQTAKEMSVNAKKDSLKFRPEKISNIWKDYFNNILNS